MNRALQLVLLLFFQLTLVAVCEDIGISGRQLRQDKCDFFSLSTPVRTILCSVESGSWNVSHSSAVMTGAGCLLGGKRCAAVMHVPTQGEVPPSPPPPDALNKDYQRLATIAEKVVPKVWWRDGFDNDLLLLSHNDSELPRKQLNIRQLSNKKLRNIYQCITRQLFIRVSLNFADTRASTSVAATSKCPAMLEPVVVKFQKLWTAHKQQLGGSVEKQGWFPTGNESNDLLVSALEVLQHFYDNYGGIWTGCFRLEKNPECRGALAGENPCSASILH